MLKDLHNKLRPMGILDILDETIEVYRRNFVLLVGIAAFLQVPLFLFTTTTQMPQMGDLNATNPGAYVAFIAKMAIFGFIYMIVSLIVTGALTFAISERYLERQTSIGACYKRVLKPKVFFSFIWANILVGVLAGAPIAVGAALLGLLVATDPFGTAGAVFGVLFIITGGIFAAYAGLRMTIVTPTFFLETNAAWPAIKRSWQLMKGSALKALGLLFITSLAVGLIQQIIQAPFAIPGLVSAITHSGQMPKPSIIGTLVSTIVSTVLMPVSSIVVIMLYYDMRIRKEGFDLELLARDLDERTREFAAGGAAALPQEQVPPPPTQEPPSSTEDKV